MSIDLILEFNLLAETLNFTEAAKQLYISQPTLSKHMSALEQELGLALIERQPTVRLTYAGREFHRKTAALLDGIPGRLDAIAGEVREAAATTKVIRMPDYTSVVEGYYGLIRSMKERFDAEYAPLSLKVEYVPVEYWRQMAARECLEAGVVDCLLWLTEPQACESERIRTFEEAGFRAFSSLECPLSLVLAKGHPLNARKRICLGDLDGIEFFSHDKSHIETAISQAMPTIFEERGLRIGCKRPFYSTDSVDMWADVEIEEEVLFPPKASLGHFGFSEQRRLVERTVEDCDLRLRGFWVCGKEAPAHVADALELMRTCDDGVS